MHASSQDIKINNQSITYCIGIIAYERLLIVGTRKYFLLKYKYLLCDRNSLE